LGHAVCAWAGDRNARKQSASSPARRFIKLSPERRGPGKAHDALG
jgi:hypothetical protein